MPKSIGVFNKGSILPSIVEIEEKLLEQESEAKKLADEEIHKAELSAEKIIEETIKGLPLLVKKERKKLIEEVDEKAGELKRIEEKEVHELEQIIERNSKKALDFILKKIIP